MQLSPGKTHFLNETMTSKQHRESKDGQSQSKRSRSDKEESSERKEAKAQQQCSAQLVESLEDQLARTQASNLQVCPCWIEITTDVCVCVCVCVCDMCGCRD